MYRILLLVFLFSLQPLTAFAVGQVTVLNTLDKCIALKEQKARVDKGLLLVDLEFRWIKETGYCGCKSLLNTYSVREHPIAGKLPIEHSWGKFIIRKDILKVSLPVTSALRVYSDKNFHMSITCARPD